MKYIHGAEFKAATPAAETEIDLLSAYQLQLANGVSLKSILDQYADHLADALDARADAWTNKDVAVNQALVSGLVLAAEQIREDVL